MNSKFIKTFAVIVIISAGMTACGQKKMSQRMMYQKRDGEHTRDCSTGNYNTGDYN